MTHLIIQSQHLQQRIDNQETTEIEPLVFPRTYEEPSMVLEAPRDTSTRHEIQSRIRHQESISSIPEINESLEVEEPQSTQPTNIRNQIPALGYNPSSIPEVNSTFMVEEPLTTFNQKE